MPVQAVVSTRLRRIAGIVVALAFALAAHGADNVPPEALNVKVFPDRYVVAGNPFADLAALEAWAQPIRLRTVWLDSCGNAATKKLMAAAERLHAVYAEGVQIRALAPADPACLEVIVAQSTEATALPVARDYLATDRYGRSVLP